MFTDIYGDEVNQVNIPRLSVTGTLAFYPGRLRHRARARGRVLGQGMAQSSSSRCAASFVIVRAHALAARLTAVVEGGAPARRAKPSLKTITSSMATGSLSWIEGAGLWVLAIAARGCASQDARQPPPRAWKDRIAARAASVRA